jgi:hypothetical protein
MILCLSSRGGLPRLSPRERARGTRPYRAASRNPWDKSDPPRAIPEAKLDRSPTAAELAAELGSDVEDLLNASLTPGITPRPSTPPMGTDTDGHAIADLEVPEPASGPVRDAHAASTSAPASVSRSSEAGSVIVKRTDPAASSRPAARVTPAAIGHSAFIPHPRPADDRRKSRRSRVAGTWRNEPLHSSEASS